MLKNYVKIALKVFWRHKFFTAVNLLGICATLILAIVATTILDMEMGQVIGNAPPEVHNDRTLHLSTVVVEQTAHGYPYSVLTGPRYAFLDRYVRTLQTAENATIFSRSEPRGLYGGAEETGLRVVSTDAAFWEIFRFDFIQGQPYTAIEAGDFVAVITDRFAKRFFGSSEVVGKRVPIDGQPHRVVGVVALSHRTRGEFWADAWVPLTTARTVETLMDDHRFRAAVLARQPEDLERVRAEFAVALSQVEPTEGQILKSALLVTALEEWMIAGNWKELAAAGTEWRAALVGLVLRKVLIAAGVGLLVLLLPVLHLVNINISRIEERTAEIGVRKAFGGSSRVLVGQFIVENVLLTLVGALLSLPVSWGVWAALTAPDNLNVLLLLRTFAYGTLIAAFFGALSGAYPAYKMAHLHPVQALTGRRI